MTNPTNLIGENPAETMRKVMERLHGSLELTGDVETLDPDKDRPSMTSIANYHPAQEAAPRHGDHRAVYAFPLSDEWQAWQAISGRPLSKEEMGEFIEDRAHDIQNPTPGILQGNADADGLEKWETRMIRLAQDVDGRFGTLPELLDMSKRFRVNEVSNLEARKNRDTGEETVVFVNEHQQPDGSPLKVPNFFMIAVPVFQNGALYRLPVRFRYRKSGSTLAFALSLYAPEKAFRDAVMGACTRAAEETGLPVIMGKPEA
ncbi:DUF2303 family protein [Ponticoccus alexandrii]|uniref:DUF2303 family protein n=1 Tax=Ponticoccus alexandrii TaxID=1943633 RepID=A0ABX7F7A8_9RHOB|nr:DUF2303 family protein [Ponticoccus alexandrii]QRF66349.1 DUF2303 family protein [Ponticoccus alexandrii]